MLYSLNKYNILNKKKLQNSQNMLDHFNMIKFFNYFQFLLNRCGIVALCMALNCLKIDCTIDQLMEKAKNLNFTKNGEIFDGELY